MYNETCRFRAAGLAGNARVLRGGSFNNNDRNARCAYRNNNDNLNNNRGFRVVASYFSLFEWIKSQNLMVSKSFRFCNGIFQCQKCCMFTDVQPRRNRRESAVNAPAGRFPFSSMGGESGQGEGVQANIKETHALHGLTIPA